MFTPQPLPTTVETAAALATARARTVDGGMIRTASFAAPGDSGGMEWIYHATGRDNVTLGAFYRGGGGSDDYFEAADKTTIRPEQVGAVGDGVTNDLPAINAMFASGATIIDFGSGEYAVSGQIQVANKSGLRIVGSATIKQQATSLPTLVLSDCENVAIDGLKFIGKGTEQPWAAASVSWNGVAAIHLDNCTGGSVSNCHITGHAGGGIRWSSVTRNLTINGNTVVGMGSPAIVPDDNGSDFAIGSTGQAFTGGTLLEQNITVSDNVISGHAFGLGVSSSAGGKNLTVIGNVFAGIPGQHAIYVQDIENVTIAGNSLESTAMFGVKVQFNLQQDFHSVAVTDNTFKDCYQGIVVSQLQAGYRVRGVSITNNVLVETGGSGVPQAGTQGDGIATLNCLDASVSDNLITGQGRYGIYASGFAGRIDNNFVRNTGHAGVLLYLHDDTYATGNVLLDTIQEPGPSSSGHFAPWECYSAPGADNATPLLELTNLTLQSTAAEQAALSQSLYIGPTDIQCKIRGLINRTSKSWRIDSSDLILLDFDYSPVADFYASQQRNPTTPIYGRGRRQLYGAQSPASADMSDKFLVGDVCWNSGATSGADLGWVCTAEGTPGTWTKFGGGATLISTTAALENIASEINQERTTGQQVWNQTTSQPVWSAGAAPGWGWINSSGVTVHVPE